MIEKSSLQWRAAWVARSAGLRLTGAVVSNCLASSGRNTLLFVSCGSETSGVLTAASVNTVPV